MDAENSLAAIDDLVKLADEFGEFYLEYTSKDGQWFAMFGDDLLNGRLSSSPKMAVHYAYQAALAAVQQEVNDDHKRR
jgi:hypothetical protein